MIGDRTAYMTLVIGWNLACAVKQPVTGVVSASPGRPGCPASECPDTTSTETAASDSDAKADGFGDESVRAAHRPQFDVEDEVPAARRCTSDDARVDMITIPAGPFRMGCDELDRSVCGRSEYPSRSVHVDTFAIDAHEVTQAAYARCVAAGVCSTPAGSYEAGTYCRHPVVAVTFADAEKFCVWSGKRLPTEAEWEKAARGPEGHRYPWGDAAPTCDRATFTDCGGEVSAVGEKPSGASVYGVLDLAGNVREWTADLGPHEGTRAIRGGMATDDAVRLRASARTFGHEAVLDARLGLRCAR